MSRSGDVRQRGQSLAEFALVSPLLGVILFALIEFGFVMNDQVAVLNAARNGARVAAMSIAYGFTSSDVPGRVQTAVSDSANSPIRCVLGTPTAVSTAGSNGQPASWTVNVSCVYTPITPLGSLFALFGGTTGSTYTITRSATMRDAACNSGCSS